MGYPCCTSRLCKGILKAFFLPINDYALQTALDLVGKAQLNRFYCDGSIALDTFHM